MVILMTWVKANWSKLLLAASLSLNVLGAGGVVPPVFAKAFSAAAAVFTGLP
jgi:hypothetical protein